MQTTAKEITGMEIGRVDAIRPVAGPVRSRPDAALDRVFAAEFRRQQQDSSQLPSRRAARGLEDETPEDDDTQIDSIPSAPESTISFFA